MNYETISGSIATMNEAVYELCSNEHEKLGPSGWDTGDDTQAEVKDGTSSGGQKPRPNSPGVTTDGAKAEALLGDESDDGPDGGWGWMIVLATVIFVFTEAIVTVSFGTLFLSFLLNLGTSSTLTASVFNLALVSSGVFSYMSGPLIEEFGWRRVAFVSALMFGVGLILSAFATSAWFLLFSISFVTGCHLLSLSSISYLIIPHYFTRWRSVANSIVASGSAISQMVMPPVITWLQEEYTFRGATLIIGALALNSCAAAMVLRPVEWHRKKSDIHHSTISHRDEQDITSITSSVLRCLKRVGDTTRCNLRYFKSPSVVIIASLLAMYTTISLNVFTMVPFVMERAGFSPNETSFCLSVCGGCNLSARLLTAFLSCRPGMRVRPVYLLGTFLSAVGIAGFSLVDSLTWKAVTLSINGFGYGLAMCLYGLIIADELGLPMLLTTLSIYGFLGGFMYLIIGPLTGVMTDLSGSYMVSLWFCVTCLLLSLMLGLFLPKIRAFELSRHHGDQSYHLHPQRQNQRGT